VLFVIVGEQKILIDPGIALGFLRNGQAPHPAQVAMGEVIQEKIIQAWGLATDIVFSHFHGDHVPLVDANPYQLDAARVADLNPGVRIWTKSLEFLSAKEQERSTALKERLDARWQEGAPGDRSAAFFQARAPWRKNRAQRKGDDDPDRG
jgi:predicted metallo-beta-lactamase superfamily hydrolase